MEDEKWASTLLWRRNVLEGCKWLLLFLSVQALGDPTFNYIKLLDKEATRQSGVSKNYLEMVDKYAVEFSVTRLPKDVARFPDENVFLHLTTMSHRDKRVCRFNAGACDEVHGGKKCYCKKVEGHEYHFIANCTARLEDVGLYLIASWQNNQQTTNVTSDRVLVPATIKYPEDDIFYSSTVTEHNPAILVCDLKRASYESPPKTNVTLQGLTVFRMQLKDLFLPELARYSYNQSANRGNQDQKTLHTHITSSNGRIVATVEGKCPNGCDISTGPNEDLVRIVIAFSNVTCEDADEYHCVANFLKTNGTGLTETSSKLTVYGRIKEIVGSAIPEKTAYQEDESVNFTCQTKGASIVKIGWKYQICPTDSQPNPPIKDWYQTSDILQNNQRPIMSGGCDKREIISELKNVDLFINVQRICLIRCEAIFNSDHKQWNKHIKYVIPVDGGYTEFNPWSECTKSCGVGQSTRVRTCTNPEPLNGGDNCDKLGPAEEFRNCNEHDCPIHGSYTEFNPWSECTKSCGVGQSTRVRTCTNPEPLNGGDNCDKLGPDEEFRNCNEQDCPIHGGYTEFNAWSECTKSCGVGQSTRVRTCTNPEPLNGGDNCDKLGPDEEIRNCNEQDCPNFSKSPTSIETTTLTPQTTERKFNNKGRNKRCNAFEYGPSCEYLCNDNCAEEGLCDEDTGVCHDGCKPGFNPPDCEKRCENGTYSVNCSKSCVNCAKNYTTGEHICEHSTGECYFGCDKGYAGDTCEKLIVLSQLFDFFTAKNISFLSVLILMIVLLGRSCVGKKPQASTVDSEKVHPIQRLYSFGTHEDSETSTGFESTMESDITHELGSSVDESSISFVPELRPIMTSRRLCPIHGKQYSGPQISVPSSVSWATTLDSSTELSSTTTSNGHSDTS